MNDTRPKFSGNRSSARRWLVAWTCVAFGCGPVLSAETGLIVGGARGKVGATVSVPVMLRANSNVVALQADILFETNKLAASPVAGAALGPGHMIASSLPRAGVQRLLVYSPNNLALSNGVLANLLFQIAPGNYPAPLRLSVTNVILVTASASTVLATNVPGVIVINPVELRPGGDVNLFLTVAPRDNYMVQASSNLVQWLDLGPVPAPSAIIEFTDTNAHLLPYRFYRAVAIP